MQIRTDLPDLYEEIKVFAEILPGRSTPLSYPFSGFVLNLNVATVGHRDTMDLLACVVIPFGKFSGGQLVLTEAGMVLPLCSGDAVLFSSCKVSHFNLQYTGTRASLVCHSDRAGLHWANGRLG